MIVISKQDLAEKGWKGKRVVTEFPGKGVTAGQSTESLKKSLLPDQQNENKDVTNCGNWFYRKKNYQGRISHNGKLLDK